MDFSSNAGEDSDELTEESKLHQFIRIIDELGEDSSEESFNSASSPDSSFDEMDDDNVMANHTVRKIMENPNLCLDEKINSIKAQYRMLKTGTNCEYDNKVEGLRRNYEEKLWLNSAAKESELERAEAWYIKDKHNARVQYSNACEQVKRDLIYQLEKLKRHLIEEWEEKKKNPMLTDLDEKDHKKLAAKSTHPMHLRNSGQSSSSEETEVEEQPVRSIQNIRYLLTESQINEDLVVIYSAVRENKASTFKATTSDMRQKTLIKDGKLFHNKKWYHRGQAVFIEYAKKKHGFPGLITSISKDVISVNDTSSGDVEHKSFTLKEFVDGKVNIKRRAF